MWHVLFCLAVARVVPLEGASLPAIARAPATHNDMRVRLTLALAPNIQTKPDSLAAAGFWLEDISVTCAHMNDGKAVCVTSLVGIAEAADVPGIERLPGVRTIRVQPLDSDDTLRVPITTVRPDEFRGKPFGIYGAPNGRATLILGSDVGASAGLELPAYVQFDHRLIRLGMFSSVTQIVWSRDGHQLTFLGRKAAAGGNGMAYRVSYHLGDDATEQLALPGR